MTATEYGTRTWLPESFRLEIYKQLKLHDHVLEGAQVHRKICLDYNILNSLTLICCFCFTVWNAEKYVEHNKIR